MKQKIFITGISGYLGELLVMKLLQCDWVAKIEGIDRVNLNKELLDKNAEKLGFKNMSVNDSKLAEYVSACEPDILVHLAFIVDPIHDEDLFRKVNVEGTQNVLNACANVNQVMVASSGTAYGAYADNPIPLTYKDPIRKHPSFEYAANKTTIEELTNAFCHQYPDKIVSIVRPTVVYGPNVDNYLSGMLQEIIIPSIKGYNPPLQFVHQEDVTNALELILRSKGSGTYNITPNDTITIQNVIERSGKKTVSIPFGLAKFLIGIAWGLKLKFQKYPAGFLDFIMFPWVMTNERLVKELEFKFKYSSKDTLDLMIEHLQERKNR